MKFYPFRDGDTHTTFRNLVESVTQEIWALENEQVLSSSLTELEDYYINKVIISPLILHTDVFYIEGQTGTQIDVSHDIQRAVFPGERSIVQGTALDIAIPFEGDPTLWKIRPSTFSMSGYPLIEVRGDVVILSVSFPDDSVPKRSEIDRQIQSLANAVQNLKNNIDAHNQTAPQTIKSALQRKRVKAESTIGAIAELGIPIKRRDKPLTYIVPTIRKESPVKQPRPSTDTYKPEPTLDEANYQHILGIMKSMSLVMERNPSTFSGLDEESIRDHFLLQLNGHYEGGATGETFNASGKTDILIRVDNRNIFIAECKFWHGMKKFNDAIDQLLGYLSWRDTKCALLIFNKTKDSTSVRQKMHDATAERSEHRRTVTHDLDGDSRYIFVKETDPGREIIITTQLYDMPTHKGAST